MAVDCPGRGSKAFPTKGTGRGRGITAEARARADAETAFDADQNRKWRDAHTWAAAQTCKTTGCKPGEECKKGRITITANPGTVTATITFAKSSRFDRAKCEITGSVDATVYCRCVPKAKKPKQKKGKIKIR